MGWFWFQIGRALLVPVGGGTHQESRNNGDRLEPWKGSRERARFRRGIPARDSGGCLVYLNGVEDPERAGAAPGGLDSPGAAAGPARACVPQRQAARESGRGIPGAARIPGLVQNLYKVTESVTGVLCWPRLVSCLPQWR